jgi:phosphate transport system substrate-binding protein
MASNNTAGAAPSLQLSNLIWQLKLQAEHKLGIKVSLRELLGNPQALEEVLAAVDKLGDDPLKKIATDVRQAQRQQAELELAPTGDGSRLSAGWLAFASVLFLLFAAVLWYFFGEKPKPAPAPAAAAVELPVSVLFRVHGSNTIGEKLAPALATAYFKSKGATGAEFKKLGGDDEHDLIASLPGAKTRSAVEIFAHGSATAFKDLLAGTTDIGMASRRVKPEEAQQLTAVDGDLTAAASENVLGLDGVAVIVNPGNPLQSLSIEQIAQAFAGTATDWSQLGGTAGPIHIYSRDDKSGTYDTFDNLVLKANNLKLLADAKRFESSSDLSDAVAADPAGIGFIGLPYVRRAKLIAVAAQKGGLAIFPTALTVGTEDYPLARRLYLYLPANSKNTDAADFVEFALSEAGQEVVNTIGFISQNLYTQAVPPDPSWPEEYAQLVAGSQRLSLDFRFESGSNQLDNKGQRDLRRVADYVAKHPGRSLVLVGFADNTGGAVANTGLSVERAKTLEAALQAQGVGVREVRGFGSAIPVASNDNDAGRQKNRRVEVWVQ